ncbi:unnamed protein product [Adineta steineri]|uniref:Uncharacterized protein n=1 Tax=Adineta steineri TaxID=433720 RepID=A0A819W422_9BILA|nr:unnamed protein product [Adineta steineri]CAF4117733.1 unnamed protein product [Adineta steineri]
MSKLGEALDYIDFLSTPSLGSCMDMLNSNDSPQLDDVLKICSEALTELSTVPKDEYNNDHIDKDRIIARGTQNIIATMIANGITKLTTNLNYKDKGFFNVRDEFFVSGDNEQLDYFVKAVQPVHPAVMATDSYNATILFAWGVYNSKTYSILSNYILEKRQEQNESIYLLRIFDSEEDSVPSYIYGKNPPMDVYYSTKLVLIHLLNGKGYLAKYEIDDMTYAMILINDEHAAKIKAEQSAEVKETIDKKQNDL